MSLLSGQGVGVERRYTYIPQLRLLPKKKMALCMTSGGTALNSRCRKEALMNTRLGEPCLVAPSSWSGVLSMLANN